MFARREARARLRAGSFSIVADDCWGGEIYRLTGRPFATPFIGVAIAGPCFMRILRDLPAALASELVPVDRSRYPDAERDRQRFPRGPFPVGVLAEVDAEILFMHYGSWDDAHEAWMRRRKRVDVADPLIKIGTHPGRPGAVDSELLAEIARLPFRRKLVLADAPVPSVNTALAPYHEDAVVRLHRGAARFDHVAWLNGGDGQVSPAQRALRTLKYAGWR